MPPVRRLTAILAADVAGYSRLMGADEEGTHERLQAHLGELVNPKIAEHRGRVVKNTGDGFLAEFASVVDAVRSFRTDSAMTPTRRITGRGLTQAKGTTPSRGRQSLLLAPSSPILPYAVTRNSTPGGQTQ